MARFPRFTRLEVDNFGLYPGLPTNPGLSVTFEPGLTLVLGANGLGKTTLVWILYRMLTGPYDIPGLDSGDDLGGRRLEPQALRHPLRRIFAQRVVDDAIGATATLSFYLGNHGLRVTRRLADLELVEFVVDDVARDLAERTSFQETIARLANLWSFGDWIIMLRYLTFYFEDRRELVWDFSAQRQILRLLFLPVDKAQHWTEAERSILTLDSRTRNLAAALTREERALAEDEQLLVGALDVRGELNSLATLQESDEERRPPLDAMLLDLDNSRRAARLQLLRAQQEREATFRSLERAKLSALQARFPKASETARYVLAQLMTESTCLVCGNYVPDAALELERRLKDAECIVCGSILDRDNEAPERVTSLVDARFNRTRRDLVQADATVETAREKLDSAEHEYLATQREMQELDASIAERRQRIDGLIRRLPKEEAALHEQRDELARLRSRVDAMNTDLTRQRKEFFDFIEEVRPSLLRHAPAISGVFQEYAHDFLFEDCTLSWEQQKARVGQSGITIDYPVFQLDMASAAFRSPVRRSGPDQVSESQREFIDLAFRMAMMRVADPDDGGTLVIDAPESSLDAVFVHRAAEVLSRFAAPTGSNRLVITSNLTDGELIPSLLSRYPPRERPKRMLDLFELAEPTAAVRSLASEYAEVRSRMLARSPENDGP